LQQDEIELMAVKCAQEGDQEAWSQLFEWHCAVLYSYCLRHTLGKQDLAEEATQEAFMIAAHTIHRFQSSNGTFRSWLFGIARNRCKKLCTAKTRRHGRENRHTKQQPKTTDCTDDCLGLVQETLAQLPAHYRCALENKYMSGHTVIQIAHANQISEHAAESLIRRAKDRFTQIYTQLKKSYIEP